MSGLLGPLRGSAREALAATYRNVKSHILIPWHSGDMSNNDHCSEGTHSGQILLDISAPLLLGDLRAFCSLAESCGYGPDDEVCRRSSNDKLRYLAIGLDLRALDKLLKQGIEAGCSD